jgi:hypothetical protein
MIIPSSPSVLDHFHSERQRQLLPTPHHQTTTPKHAGLRVRVGHALIGAGAALSGERVEPPHPHPRPRTA